MFYSFYLISFIIVAHILFPISNANQMGDDKMPIAFMKGQQESQLSEFSKQKYEAYIGIMYYMRNNWQCDEIADEFEEYERKECQKYRKYLDILYEYFYREYVGILTVKPKFVVKKEIEIDGPIIYAVNCLAKMSQFYFNSLWSEFYEYKLNVHYYFEQKLLNEERLNYGIKLENEQKLPINEMILQLAIDIANEWQTNESLDGIIRQNFEENLEEMFKKAEEKAKKDKPERAYLINDDKHWIIIDSKFDDQRTWTEDALFSEFIKGLATNFEKFFKMAKEYQYNLYQGEEHLTQRFEARLGVLYLMRENWHCEKIGNEFEEKCQKFRKYLDILYEYFFKLYAEAKNPKMMKQLPPLVKPIFIEAKRFPCSLNKVVKMLNDYSKSFWKKKENEFENINYIWELNLENEKELNFEMKKDKNWFHKFIKKGKQILKGQTNIERIRKEFEEKMEKIYEYSKEEMTPFV